VAGRQLEEAPHAVQHAFWVGGESEVVQIDPERVEAEPGRIGKLARDGGRVEHLSRPELDLVERVGRSVVAADEPAHALLPVGGSLHRPRSP
jgi:hypothetical protein